MHQVRVSRGALVGLLARTASVGQPVVDQLKAEARASPSVHLDETGWRKKGQNGYIWVCATPGEQALRYYEYRQSRAGAVVKRLLDGQFRGCRSSDCSGAYNESYAGPKQKCWAHLLRDRHDLKEAQGQNLAVAAWARAVRALYDQATAFLASAPPPSPAERTTH